MKPNDPQELVHVARQPIFDAAERLHGYELLYRASAADRMSAVSQDVAAARVLTDSCLTLGLSTLTLGRRAFFKFTKGLLLSCAGTLLPPPSTVIELGDDLDLDKDVMEACAGLHGMGYALALDNVTLRSNVDALLPFAKYVKIDVLATSVGDRAELAKRLLPLGVKLVAASVDSFEAAQSVRAAGYHLVQGFFFCRPRTFSSPTLSARRSAYVRLLATLNRREVSVGDVEELIKDDPSLVYRVLRSVNSAAFAIQREVTSIRQAVVLLGLDQIRKWASVWAMAGANSGGTHELTTMALLRARSCEFLGEHLEDSERTGWFLLGLCSLLDAMLGRPMEQVLQELPLSDDLKQALLGRSGPSRSILDAVIAYERGAFDRAAGELERVGLTIDLLSAGYDDALRWAKELEDPALAA